MNSDYSEYSNYIKSKKVLQEKLLKYISSEDNIEENYENLNICFKDQNLFEEKSELKILLYMLTKISNFLLRSPTFFDKIEKIILNFKDIIKTNFSNDEIYQIFQTSKRLLLFLIEEKFLKFDEKIYELNKNNTDYLFYFYPEFSNFIKSNSLLRISSYKQIIDYIKNNEEEFRKKRKVGENDLYICEIIRKDDISNFITYINKNQLSLLSRIKPSIYETNIPLIKLGSQPAKGQDLNLIVYTLYFGSNQIFNYLYKNNVTLSPWMLQYAIHGGDPSIINVFEENSRLLTSNNLQIFFESAIEFFNTDAAFYIQRKHPRSSKIQSSLKSIEYYNFIFFPRSLSANEFSLLCKNGYLQLAKYALKNFDVQYDLNFLVELIESYQFEVFKLLFENKTFDMNKSNFFNRRNLLSTAVNMENVDLVKYLLDSNKIDPNQNCQLHIYHGDQYYTGTALCFAIKNKNFEITSLLLNNPSVDVNGSITDSFSFGEDDRDDDDHIGRLGTVEYTKTPLIIAIENNDVKTIELLLKKPNINVNINRTFKYEYEFQYEHNYRRGYSKKDFECDKKGKCEISPFLLALIGNNVNIVKLLLSKDDIDINSEFQIIKNSDEIIKFIKKVIYRTQDSDDVKGHEIEEIREKISPISYAIENCDSEILDALLNTNKVNISFYGNSLLKRAILIKNNSMINNLFADSNFDFQNALKSNLITAVMANNMTAFEMLLKRPEVNVNDNDGSNTALIASIKMNNMDAFAQLLERPEININDKVGYKTALKKAVEENNLNAVKALLSRNDINVNDNNGDVTALKIAVDLGEIDIVKALLARNDIDVNDNSGNKTALKLAVKKRFHDIVGLLLDRKEIDVNDNCDGETAIKIAADNLDMEMVKLLTTRPEIIFNPETIYNDVNHDKLSIILYLVDLKNKK